MFPENIVMLEDWKARHPDFNTFLSNEKEISRNIFRNSTVKNSVEEEIINLIKQAPKKELENIMDELGESYFKYMILRD